MNYEKSNDLDEELPTPLPPVSDHSRFVLTGLALFAGPSSGQSKS